MRGTMLADLLPSTTSGCVRVTLDEIRSSQAMAQERKDAVLKNENKESRLCSYPERGRRRGAHILQSALKRPAAAHTLQHLRGLVHQVAEINLEAFLQLCFG